MVLMMAGFHETDNYFSENSKNIDIQKIKRRIKALKDVKSEKKSLFTIVISPRDEISDITKMLEGWISDEKYQDAKEAITFALQILENYNRVPDNGLIIYTGVVYTDDGKKDVKIGFEPFKLIFKAFSRISDMFAIKALDNLLEPPLPIKIFFSPVSILSSRVVYRTPDRATRDEYDTLDRSTWDFLLGVYYGPFSDEKKCIYGVDTFKRLHDLKILFVCENLGINCCRVENTRTGKVFTKHLNKDELQILEETPELKILEKTPLLDWLAQVNQDRLFGYRLVFVSDTTREGSKFRELGGIGAILRDNVNIWVWSFVWLLVGLVVACMVTRSTFKLMMDK